MLDQFMSARSIIKQEIGVVISSAPSASELLTALDDTHSNMEKYHANVKTVRETSSKDSLQKLESFIDTVADKKQLECFGIEESLYMSITKAFLIIFPILFIFLGMVTSPFVVFIYCCCRYRRKKNAQNNDSKKTK